MLDFIIKYWVQELFAILIAAVTALWKKIGLKKKEYEVLRKGILSLLHDRLYMACSFYINKGYCSVEDRRNLEYLFGPYKELGGNGTAEALYNKCHALPIKPPDEDEEGR